MTAVEWLVEDLGVYLKNNFIKNNYGHKKNK